MGKPRTNFDIVLPRAMLVPAIAAQPRRIWALLGCQYDRRVDRHTADGDRDQSDGALQSAIGPSEPSRGSGERHRDDYRQRAHSDHRPDAKQYDIEHSVGRICDLRHSEDKQRCRAGHPMHQSDQQCPPPKAVSMQMRAVFVRDRLIQMAVDMDMFRTISVPVPMEVHAITP